MVQLSPRITVSGYYGFGNAGDEALLSALVSDLYREVKGAELTVLSRDPAETSRTHGVKAIDRFHPASVLGLLRKTDLFISGGGTLLQDKTSLRSIVYYSSLALAAARIGARVMLYASGLGPLESRLGRYLARRVILRADAVTLRDNLSRQKLDQLFGETGLPPELESKVRITADPAFGLPPVSPMRVKEMMAQEGLTEFSQRILFVSLRPWEGETRLVEAVSGALSDVGEKASLKPVFLPMQHPDDLPLAHRVASMIGSGSHVITRRYAPQEVIGLLGQGRAVVGMRLHSLIMAVTAGIPCIGLIYDPKISGFLEDLGMPSAGMVQELARPALRQAIIDFLDSLETYRGRIRSQLGVLRELARENARIASKLLA